MFQVWPTVLRWPPITSLASTLNGVPEMMKYHFNFSLPKHKVEVEELGAMTWTWSWCVGDLRV